MTERKRKRPAISDGMKYRSLKLHGSVLVRCFDCVKELERLRAVPINGWLALDDTGTWHKLENIQFDHVWELADGGKHGAKHLRPKCIPHHKLKSKAAEKLRHHLDRASKKARGVFKRKSLPMQSRGFETKYRKKMNGSVEKRT